MTNNQFISISLSAMAAGSALSSIVICFFSSDPQPVVAIAVCGISALLSSVSAISVIISSRAAEEKIHHRQDSASNWFNDWVREHDHEHEIANVRLDRKMEEFDRNISQRIDHVDRQISRVEETSASVISTLQSMMPMQDRG